MHDGQKIDDGPLGGRRRAQVACGQALVEMEWSQRSALFDFLLSLITVFPAKLIHSTHSILDPWRRHRAKKRPERRRLEGPPKPSSRPLSCASLP